MAVKTAVQLRRQRARALVEAANNRGGPDNISVIVIEVLGSKAVSARGGVPATLTETGVEVWGRAKATLQGVRFDRDVGTPTLILILTGLLVALAIIGLGYALGRLLFG